MVKASEDVQAFRHYPPQNWEKVWSTLVVGVFRNDATFERLAGAVLLEQDELWQLEGRRMFSAE
jgi:putative transposase